MQYLELKMKTGKVKRVVGNEVVEVEKQLPYRQLVQDVVNHSPQGGFSLDETTARLRIRKALHDCKKSCLSLEDADAEKLKKCVREMRWGYLDPAFEEFSTDVLAMKVEEKSTSGNGKDAGSKNSTKATKKSRV